MKKIIKIMILTLSTVVILNAGVKTINAENINNKSNGIVQVENQVKITDVYIDPDSKGK